LVDQVSELPKSLGIISTLEKADELRHSLLLFAFVLFLDSAMLISRGSGLVSLYANPDALKVDVVLTVALAFVFFSLCMSLIVPLFVVTLRQLVQEHSPLSPPSYRSMLYAGYVPDDDLRHAAHSTQDQYLLDLEKEAKETKRQTEEQLLRFFVLSTSCFLLSVFNLLYSSQSLLRQIGLVIPQMMILLPILFFGMTAWLAVRTENEYVYCPSVADKLKADLPENKRGIPDVDTT
jgi:hypothetical protein